MTCDVTFVPQDRVRSQEGYTGDDEERWVTQSLGPKGIDITMTWRARDSEKPSYTPTYWLFLPAGSVVTFNKEN